jgi:hypothetical protein
VKLHMSSLVSVTLACLTSPALASLVGDSVAFSLINADGDVLVDQTVIVGGGPELAFCARSEGDACAVFLTFDIGASNITTSLRNDSAIDVEIRASTIVFDDLDWTGDGLVLVAAELVSNTYPIRSEVSVGAHAVTIASDGYPVPSGAVFTSELQLLAAPVPLPGGAVLLSSAGALLLGLRRRGARSAAARLTLR